MSTSKTGKTWMTPEVKKPWSEPALIVLVRGKPEEALLLGCKTGVQGVPGPSGSACGQTLGCCQACTS